MQILKTLIPNQIAYVNQSRLSPKCFSELNKLDFSLPCFVCLTDYKAVAPIFEWLGLKNIAADHNYNSYNTNHIYYGFVDRDKLNTLLTDGAFNEQTFKKEFIESIVLEVFDKVAY